jgi:hypothetical protein
MKFWDFLHYIVILINIFIVPYRIVNLLEDFSDGISIYETILIFYLIDTVIYLNKGFF